MISSRAYVQRLVQRAAPVLLLAIPIGAGAGTASSATDPLRAFIQANPELQAVFGRSSIDGASPARASATADLGTARHAVVLYREALSGSTGELFCYAALAMPERAQWLAQLRALPGSDDQVADLLDQAHPLKTSLRQVQFHSITAPSGWRAAVCAVRREDLTPVFPPRPEPANVRAASYIAAKQLFASGRLDEALGRFKALKSDADNYPNALLFIVAILDDRAPSIAETLRRDHVRLAAVTDVDALNAYIQASVARGYLANARTARDKCDELGNRCR